MTLHSLLREFRQLPPFQRLAFALRPDASLACALRAVDDQRVRGREPREEGSMIAPGSWSARWAARSVAAAVFALAVAGCGGGDGGSDPIPVANVDAVPETVTLFVGETRQATAKTMDVQGNDLPDRRVTWSSSAASVAAVSESGLISAVGAGTAQITATSEGHQDVVTITVLARVASVIVEPTTLDLAVGQEHDLGVALFDGEGNALSGRPLFWSTSNASIVSVTLAGRVRGVGPGNAVVTVSSEGQTAAVQISVTGEGGSNCGALTPTVLAVGEVRRLADAARSTLCLPPDGDYALVAFSGLSAGSVGMNFEALGTRAAVGPPSPAIAPAADVAIGGPSRSLAVGASFERDLRDRARGAAREFGPGARRVATERRAARAAGRAPAGGVNLSLSPTLALELGDLVTLNGNAEGNGCTAPRSDRGGRVAAVSARAVVVADTANPANGFTDDDYRQFAEAFDANVYPVDVAAFGEPTDIDESSRTIIFFTRAVNELTERGASSYVGGFFFGRDLLPRAPIPAQNYSGCAGSNEVEMFYMLVPDPTGVVNGNVRTKEFVRSRTIGVLGHEFQHLINFGRRLYVNNALDFEETWLDEGLSHVAEELLYYRAAEGAGLEPRQNLTIEAVRQAVTALNDYQASNLGRLSEYLRKPASNSPYASNDELATRGAAWQYLRYVADRRGGDEHTLWHALVNSRVSGFENLEAALGTDPVDLARDWAVAQYVDDAGLSSDPIFSHPSWNFRSVLPALSSNGGTFPLATVRVLPGATGVSLAGGGAAYLRFGVDAGGDNAYVGISSQGQAPPAAVDLTLIRTR